MKTKLILINTYLRRYTFESQKIKSWVESRSRKKVLNLFAGKTELNLDEYRVDIDKNMNADWYGDALDFINTTNMKFDTIILDPPYSYRKSIEMYNGHKNSRFKQIADNIHKILNKNGIIISFGYHSSFMGRIRGFNLTELCIFAHGGSQHCTIAIIEKKIKS